MEEGSLWKCRVQVHSRVGWRGEAPAADLPARPPSLPQDPSPRPLPLTGAHSGDRSLHALRRLQPGDDGEGGGRGRLPLSPPPPPPPARPEQRRRGGGGTRRSVTSDRRRQQRLPSGCGAAPGCRLPREPRVAVRLAPAGSRRRRGIWAPSEGPARRPPAQPPGPPVAAAPRRGGEEAGSGARRGDWRRDAPRPPPPGSGSSSAALLSWGRSSAQPSAPEEEEESGPSANQGL
ncbi:Hypothetical predicted protein [Podarcis lilfordi]|uniref:Uncharacterized protein n=1 Tax=Podarcis lilfordi TaxID=74358 RepID=A0AA35KRB5_9SAUR|nr:Hypothetical predicted protein [Podarcis lilfordi]